MRSTLHKNDINYKLRQDLNISKDKELESVFTEILTKKFANKMKNLITHLLDACSYY